MTTPTLGRRTFLASTGSVALGAGLAGCLDVFADDRDCDDPEETVLLSARENGLPVDDPPFPTRDEPVPDVTVPAPLHDRDVSTSEFVCDRHQVYTFIFTRCHEACPVLTGVLQHVQADAVDRGYADDVALVQITFDPEHDTAEVLADFEEIMGVDPGPGNWYSLRPETTDRAKTVVHDQFGQEYTALDTEEEEDDGFDLDDLDDDPHEDDGMQMPFMHISLLLVANKAGYIERAYAYDPPHHEEVIDDVRALVDRW